MQKNMSRGSSVVEGVNRRIQSVIKGGVFPFDDVVESEIAREENFNSPLI